MAKDNLSQVYNPRKLALFGRNALLGGCPSPRATGY